eukprot:675543-Pleurochrysis_carterae.AAC.1
MPTPLVSDGREPLPSDSNGVEAHKESRKTTLGVSSQTAFARPPDLPGSGSSTTCFKESLITEQPLKVVR